MLGLDFDSVVSNVRLLLEKNTDDIKIVLTAVATSKYTPSRSEIENLFLPWKPAISISGCHSRGGTIDNLVTAIPESMGLSRCGLYNSHNFLSWKGTLHACCHDIEGLAKIGSLDNVTLEEIAKRKIKMISTGQFYSICESCDEPKRTAQVDYHQ